MQGQGTDLMTEYESGERVPMGPRICSYPFRGSKSKNGFNILISLLCLDTGSLSSAPGGRTSSAAKSFHSESVQSPPPGGR